MAERHAQIAAVTLQHVVLRLKALTLEDLAQMTFDDLATLVLTAEAVERRARGLPDAPFPPQRKQGGRGGKREPGRVCCSSPGR
jgi:hypothetical protein